MEWIEHQGKKILNNDLSGLSVEAFMERMTAFEAMVLGLGERNILVLSDIRGAQFDSRNVNLLKKIALAVDGYVGRYAVVGVSGVKKILFNAVQVVSGKQGYLEAFDTLEAAKDWLVR